MPTFPRWLMERSCLLWKDWKLLFVLMLLALACLLPAGVGHAQMHGSVVMPVPCQNHPEAARLAFAGPDPRSERCFAGAGEMQMHPVLADVIGACAAGQPILLLFDPSSDASLPRLPHAQGQISLWVPAASCRFVADAFAGLMSSMPLTTLLLSPDERGIMGTQMPTGIHRADCHAQPDLFTLWWDQGQHCLGFAMAGSLTLTPAVQVEAVCSGSNRGRIAFVPEEQDVLTSIVLWVDPTTCVQVQQVLPLPALLVNHLLIFPRSEQLDHPI